MRTLGRTGLNQHAGVVYEEWLPELQGERGRRVVREMLDQDPVIGGVLLAIRSIIMQVQWDVIPADKSPAAARWAELARTSLHDMDTDFSDLISDILSFLPYGFSLEEPTFKLRQGDHRDPMKASMYDDGLIGWADWGPRAQTSVTRWGFEGDQITGVYQGDGGNEIFIPKEKLLHFKTSVHKGNPEGRSMLRNAYRPWYFKKHLEQIEAIGVERDLAGLPVAKIPAELFDEENRSADQAAVYNAIKKGVENIRNDESAAIIVPSDRDEKGHLLYEIELMSSPGQRQFETTQIIERWDTRILMSMLADFIILGHEAVGSFALSNDKTNLFATAMGAVIDIIESTLNRQAIKRLMKVNGAPVALCPRLEAQDIETNSLPDLGKFVADLAKGGFNLVDLETENYLRSQANLPRVTALNRTPMPGDDESGPGSEPNDGEDDQDEDE